MVDSTLPPERVPVSLPNYKFSVDLASSEHATFSRGEFVKSAPTDFMTFVRGTLKATPGNPTSEELERWNAIHARLAAVSTEHGTPLTEAEMTFVQGLITSGKLQVRVDYAEVHEEGLTVEPLNLVVEPFTLPRG